PVCFERLGCPETRERFVRLGSRRNRSPTSRSRRSYDCSQRPEAVRCDPWAQRMAADIAVKLGYFLGGIVKIYPALFLHDAPQMLGFGLPVFGSDQLFRVG